MGDLSVNLTYSSNIDVYTPQSLIDELVQETILRAFNVQNIADLRDFIPTGKRVGIKPNWFFYKPAKKSNLDCRLQIINYYFDISHIGTVTD